MSDETDPGEPGQHAVSAEPLHGRAEHAEPPPLDHFSCALDDSSNQLDDDQWRWLHDHAQRAIACALRRALAPAAHSRSRDETASVRVRIVDAAAMATLHEQTLGVDEPTDVLTFDLREASASPLDVDIAICADIARERAADLRTAVEHELLLYIVHGVLHCLGHDDRRNEDAQRMHAVEDAILAEIGVGPVYKQQPPILAGAERP